MEKDIVIYGIGSPLVVDFEESLSRAGLHIRAAVQNVDGQNWLPSGPHIATPGTLNSELFSVPYLVPLFTPGHRQMAAKEAAQLGFLHPFSLVDRTAIVPRTLTAGHGLYVNSGCIVGAGGQFGAFVCINRGANIGHHARFDDFVSIGPGAVLAGMVTIGKGALVSAGAVILPGITIGENAVVGAGSVVTRDVPANTLVVGNPARVIKEGIIGHNGVGVV